MYVHVLQDILEMTDMHTYRSSGVKPPTAKETAQGKASCWRERGPAAPSTMEVPGRIMEGLVIYDSSFSLYAAWTALYSQLTLKHGAVFRRIWCVAYTWQCNTRVNQPVERNFGALRILKEIYCVKQLTCQHKLLSFLCQYKPLCGIIFPTQFDVIHINSINV